jgi:hypothetical protein
MLHRMLFKTLDRGIPGPLMEKKVLQNEKIVYYSKRYCPVKEKKSRKYQGSSQLMDFHPLNHDESSIIVNDDDLDNDKSFFTMNDAVIGLKLDPPELRRVVPRRYLNIYNHNNCIQAENNSRNQIRHTK